MNADEARAMTRFELWHWVASGPSEAADLIELLLHQGWKARTPAEIDGVLGLHYSGTNFPGKNRWMHNGHLTVDVFATGSVCRGCDYFSIPGDAMPATPCCEVPVPYEQTLTAYREQARLDMARKP